MEASGGLPKVDAHLSRTDEDVKVHLTSEDLPSLRAAVNSFLRWATMAAEVAHGAEEVMGNVYDVSPHQGA